jgi:heat shock protein HslJ
MKRIRLWQCIIPYLLLSMLLTSCGDKMTGGPGTAEPTPNSTSSASPDNSPSATSSILGSTSTTQPQETCAAFLPSTPCSRYTSVSGTTSGKELPWVSSGSVKARLTSVNGELQLSVTTPCGPLSAQATITGNTLTAKDIATGASGCTGDTGEQQLWVTNFLKRAIEMTFSQGTLNWKSGTDTLSFKSD